ISQGRETWRCCRFPSEDQFENLDKHTQWGIDFLERYAKFVKERLDVEQTYAKQLRYVRSYTVRHTNITGTHMFTSCVSFYSILGELNDYAGQREVVAEEMSHKVYNELMRYSQELKAERKHHLQEGRKAQQFLDHCWKQMDNSKKKFERECREAEKAQMTFDRLDNDINATKSEVEKVSGFHLLALIKNKKLACLQQLSFTFFPLCVQNLQNMDERRTVKLGETYRSFAEAERRVIPIVSKCLDGMVSAAKSVDERRDSAIVVESFKSGFEPPGDFPFEDFSQNLSRTGSDGTISNTPKAERDLGPIPRSEAKQTIGRSKNKLWLFGKKPKVPSLEDFSHLPPEQRRKRLQQKIDELNRELQKETDQRDALNKMKDVYEKNPQMGDPNSLQPKISETICNMQKLRSEIHKNESWLSEVEGKQSSRGERRHSADNHHHTPGRESPEGSYTDDTSQEHHTPRHRPAQPAQPNPDPHEFDDEFDDDDPLPVIGHCKALYSFDGQNEGTLKMAEDEVLYVIEEDKGDGWTRARKQSGEEGYVPTSYVEITIEKNSKGAVTYI
uniref:Formin binding protein 1-like n=1 Tax=Fundulus heteroclitus TaxID=8078 RepID=A0A3Q2P820_FUNHE